MNISYKIFSNDGFIYPGFVKDVYMFARVRFLCTSVLQNSIFFVEMNSDKKETHDGRTPNSTPQPVMANVKIDDRSLSGQVICIFNSA